MKLILMTLKPLKSDTLYRCCHMVMNFTVSFSCFFFSKYYCLSSHGVCNAISAPAAVVSFIEHSVPNVFTLSYTGAIKSPLLQSKFY